MPSIHVKEPIPPEDSQEKAEVKTVEESIVEQQAAPTQPKDYRKLFLAGSIVFLLLLVVFVVSLMNDRRQLKQKVDKLSAQTQKPAEDQTKEEAEQLKQEIGKYLELPADETPTVATVVDANKVKGQSFFTNTQNGDKVLLFAKSGKAILYRPSTKKIVEVAPINLNQNQQSETSAPSTTPTTKTNR